VKSGSVFHGGETDSSDYEYSYNGRGVKKMLALQQEQFERYWMPSATLSWKTESAAAVSSACHTKQIATATDRHRADSVFGVWVINSLVSSVLLTEKMQNLEVVPLMRLESHDATGRASNDRVVTGVMIQKPCLKLPLVDMQYYFWTLSGPRENLKIILTIFVQCCSK